MKTILILMASLLIGCSPLDSNPNTEITGVDTLSTQSAVTTIPADDNYFLILSSVNEVWVSSLLTNGYVSRFTSDGQLIAQIPTRSQPLGLAEDAYGYIWVAEFGASTVSKIDPTLNQVVETIDTCTGPYGLIYHDGFMYVTIQGENLLMKIDVLTGISSTIPIGIAPHNMTIDGDRLLVANENSHDIDVVDINTFTVTETIPVSNGKLVNVIVDRGNKIWTTGYADSSVYVIDPALRRIPLSLAMGLILDGDRIIATSALNGFIVEFDLCGDITRQFDIPNAPTVRNLVRVGNNLWVAGFQADVIHVVPWD